MESFVCFLTTARWFVQFYPTNHWQSPLSSIKLRHSGSRHAVAETVGR